MFLLSFNFKLFLTRYKHALICFVLTILFSSTIIDYVYVLSNVPKLFTESLIWSLVENFVEKRYFSPQLAGILKVRFLGLQKYGPCVFICYSTDLFIIIGI